VWPITQKTTTQLQRMLGERYTIARPCLLSEQVSRVFNYISHYITIPHPGTVYRNGLYGQLLDWYWQTSNTGKHSIY